MTPIELFAILTNVRYYLLAKGDSMVQEQAHWWLGSDRIHARIAMLPVWCHGN
jgi:hypothetical protein